MNPLHEISAHAVRTPKLVLSMIAGNEERVIARCLASAAPHVDAMVISTNGQDRTEEIARSVGAQVVREPWRDFGYNRTRAAQAARRHALHDLGFDGRNTYLLLLDADMVLRVDDPDFRGRLTFPHYRIDQRQGTYRHENSRLLRLDHDWRCVKRTHEYWAPFPDVWPERFDGIWIDDLNDGGEHGKKYERDVEYLLKDLEDYGPGDARSLFYLAETYFHWAQQAEEQKQPRLAIERFYKAVEFYERRWNAGDWDEERWFARYKWGLAALALERLKEGAGGIELLLEAYDFRPGRAEVPAELARHYRTTGKNALAVLFAKTARATPPTRDALFVEESAWTTKPDEDLAISSYYVGDLEGGMAACDRLTRARHLGPGFQDFVLKTAAFYMPHALPALRRGTFQIPPEVLEGGRWAPSTPTIVPCVDGFLVGVRLVNYWQERGRCYVSRDADTHIRTQTAVVHLGRDLETQRFLGVQEYVPPEGWRQGWEGGVAIFGLEDERWCLHNNEIWFTATTFDGDPPRGPRVVLGRLSDDGLKVEFLTDLHYDRATNCEKNWVPRSRAGRLELIYSYDPFVVLEVDTETGKCVEVVRAETPVAAWMWRGGAFDANDYGKYGLVHERVNYYREGVEDRNVYFHRFFQEENRKIVDVKRPFTFDHQGIEYAAGLIVGPERVIVTYSVEDKEAKFVVLSRKEFEK